MMNLKNLQKEFDSGQLLTAEDMSLVKGGLLISYSLTSTSLSLSTTIGSTTYSLTATSSSATITSATNDDKRRERPGGGITTL
jgi:hypothetical protein